ncbi:TetR/AcrR family transcriptional regulator [Pseudonocardia spinosispora]|uniref:TetR/AcrR family transcriptional regulator n=1 Tax=Pseudonocardia spinosispora TaxID=103441 RepID=UPI0003FD28D2|nr:TetR/AcrR family transcriptional regulator [Pseudonocardia spinosispora]
MAEVHDGTHTAPARRTARGLQTRSRILDSATTLFYVKGVNATTLDDVRVASSTSKSQLYNHFPDKLALVHAAIDMQSEFVLAREEQRLRGVRTLAGLRRWRDAIVQANDLQDGSYGCALGCLSVEMSDTDEESRTALASSFDAWKQLLTDALARLRDIGVLDGTADPRQLGTGLLAALQGGYLLAQNAHSSEPLATALDMALAHIESFATR